jgi:hypothetical protein
MSLGSDDRCRQTQPRWTFKFYVSRQSQGLQQTPPWGLLSISPHRTRVFPPWIDGAAVEVQPRGIIPGSIHTHESDGRQIYWFVLGLGLLQTGAGNVRPNHKVREHDVQEVADFGVQ